MVLAGKWIHGILKKFVVLPEEVWPVWERLPRVFLVARNFNLADAALRRCDSYLIRYDW